MPSVGRQIDSPTRQPARLYRLFHDIHSSLVNVLHVRLPISARPLAVSCLDLAVASCITTIHSHMRVLQTDYLGSV